MKFCVIHPLTGELQDRVSLSAGQSYTMRGLPAFVLRGRMNSLDDGCTDYTAKPKTAGRLVKDGVLKPGESIQSPNKQHTLVYQGDNNLVLYSPNGPSWSSGTAGMPDADATVMQGDGNLVIYNGKGRPIWSSGTAGNDDAYLSVNNDGELSIYDRDDKVIKDLYLPPAILRSGSSMQPGELIAIRNLEFVYQGDGNLVLYRKGSPIWSSGTADNNAGSLQMQGDGNLVVYDGQGVPVWSSGTAEFPGGYLGIHSDGRLIMYNSDGGQVKIVFGGK
jgi:hypothetical protein